jgi:hypothetical protein
MALVDYWRRHITRIPYAKDGVFVILELDNIDVM